MDRLFMEQALELAGQARGRTHPNPMVGAVVVKNGTIIGSGYHARAGEPHAEVNALAMAGETARGATLYVNLEPCAHYGRTPPCTEKIIAAGIARVVMAMTDPNPGVSGRGIARLKEAGILVECGVCAAEAGRLNEVFVKYITAKRPFIAMKTAMSLDGKITNSRGQSQWITGESSRQWVHRLRDQYTGIMVGINTVLSDDPQLTTRLPDGEGRDAVRIVLDSRGRTPPDARIVRQSSAAATLVAVTPAAPADKIAALTARGVTIITIRDKAGRIDLDDLLARLAEREIDSILLEGGSTLNAAFLAANLVDKLYLFVAPKLIGGRQALTPVGGDGFAPDVAKGVSELTVTRCGEDFLFEGYVKQGS